MLHLDDVVRTVATVSMVPSCSIVIHHQDGKQTVVGDGEPVLAVYVRTTRGDKALRSLSLLEICEAYIRSDIDLEGDLIEAAAFQRLLSDRQPWIKLWRHAKPLVLGRARCNPGWIEKHYDSYDIQLLAADRVFHTYTPGIYTGEMDTLEAGAARKLQVGFESLQLGPGKSLLDVGCGWGGFVRYCASRGVEVTGITLSHGQARFVRDLLKSEILAATVLYQDFFTFKPARRYDAIALMGVLEDLSDYGFVMRRLAEWVNPKGRVYLDFASSKDRFGTSSFITKHIWPGTFRMVYLPELISAISRSPFEIVALDNDRANYHYWARESYRRWHEQHAAVTSRTSEGLWRTFRIMHAGTTHVMSSAASGTSAFRMVLEHRTGG